MELKIPGMDPEIIRIKYNKVLPSIKFDIPTKEVKAFCTISSPVNQLAKAKAAGILFMVINIHKKINIQVVNKTSSL